MILVRKCRFYCLLVQYICIDYYDFICCFIGIKVNFLKKVFFSEANEKWRIQE